MLLARLGALGLQSYQACRSVARCYRNPGRVARDPQLVERGHVSHLLRYRLASMSVRPARFGLSLALRSNMRMRNNGKDIQLPRRLTHELHATRYSGGDRLFSISRLEWDAISKFAYWFLLNLPSISPEHRSIHPSRPAKQDVRFVMPSELKSRHTSLKMAQTRMQSVQPPRIHYLANP